MSTRLEIQTFYWTIPGENESNLKQNQFALLNSWYGIVCSPGSRWKRQRVGLIDTSKEYRRTIYSHCSIVKWFASFKVSMRWRVEERFSLKIYFRVSNAKHWEIFLKRSLPRLSKKTCAETNCLGTIFRKFGLRSYTPGKNRSSKTFLFIGGSKVEIFSKRTKFSGEQPFKEFFLNPWMREIRLLVVNYIIQKLLHSWRGTQF